MILSVNTNKDKEDNNRETSSVATLEKPKVKKPPLYRVILLNDDYTPMEFVVYVLLASRIPGIENCKCHNLDV